MVKCGTKIDLFLRKKSEGMSSGPVLPFLRRAREDLTSSSETGLVSLVPSGVILGDGMRPEELLLF